MLKISLCLLEKRDLELTGEVPAAELDLPVSSEESFGPVVYELQVSRIGGGVLVRGRLTSALHGPCGRCLVMFDLPVTVADVCHFYEQPAGEELDLAPELREDLLIGVPVKRLCREDCRGWCPVCGGDRNRRNCACSTPSAGAGVLAELDLPSG